LRYRIVAADAGALVLLFLVTRFGDEALQLAGLAGVVAFRRGHDKQRTTVRRQRSAFDLHVVADVERQRRARRITLRELVGVLLLRVAVGLDLAQRREIAQLLLAEIVRLLRV